VEVQYLQLLQRKHQQCHFFGAQYINDTKLREMMFSMDSESFEVNKMKGFEIKNSMNLQNPASFPVYHSVNESSQDRSIDVILLVPHTSDYLQRLDLLRVEVLTADQFPIE
jgi:hypothetical protein